MTRELPYFYIGSSCGGSQEWFIHPMMKLGGCAAATACDSCIYFDLYLPELHPEGRPFSACPVQDLDRRTYSSFGVVMRPYLRPRMGGIDRLDIYIDGLSSYLRDRGISGLSMEGLPGDVPFPRARESVREQIDARFPVPCLILKHSNPAFDDYVWHWFLLTGYRDDGDSFYVKAVTYGKARWLNFGELWDTGDSRRGGLILYHAG